MTPEEIDVLTPEQLRIEVAVQVMGLCYHNWQPKSNSPRPTKFVCLNCLKEACGADSHMPPDFPNDIAAAWKIVDKFKQMVCLDDLCEEIKRVPDLISMSAPDAAYAICLAALKAVQGVAK